MQLVNFTPIVFDVHENLNKCLVKVGSQFSQKNNISGSTGSKKSLEMGKYFLNQGSPCCEYFTDALSILVLFLLVSMFCLHVCRQ